MEAGVRILTMMMTISIVCVSHLQIGRLVRCGCTRSTMGGAAVCRRADPCLSHGTQRQLEAQYVNQIYHSKMRRRGLRLRVQSRCFCVQTLKHAMGLLWYRLFYSGGCAIDSVDNHMVRPPGMHALCLSCICPDFIHVKVQSVAFQNSVVCFADLS